HRRRRRRARARRDSPLRAHSDLLGRLHGGDDGDRVGPANAMRGRPFAEITCASPRIALTGFRREAMPHVVVQYTANLDPEARIGARCKSLAEIIVPQPHAAGARVFPIRGPPVLPHATPHFPGAYGPA